MQKSDLLEILRNNNISGFVEVEINGTRMSAAKALEYAKSHTCKFNFYQEAGGLTSELGSMLSRQPVYKRASQKSFVEKLPTKPGYNKPTEIYRKPRKPIEMTEKKIPEYVPDLNYFTCGSVGVVMRNRRVKPIFSDKKNVFTAKDSLVHIVYDVKGCRNIYNISNEVNYNGELLSLTTTSDYWPGYDKGVDKLSISELIKKGGYGRFDVNIRIDGVLKKKLEFYIIK